MFPACIRTAAHLADRTPLYLPAVINRPDTPPSPRSFARPGDGKQRQKKKNIMMIMKKIKEKNHKTLHSWGRKTKKS